MIIVREIGGKKTEFVLTSDELYDAYREQQYLFDRADIEDQFEVSDEDCVDCWGITRKEAEPLFDDMAAEMRRNIDKYDMSWEYARPEAIREVIRRECANNTERRGNA